MAVNPAEGASPPVFEQIFRNARFAQGGNALFEGKVKGNPRPQVVWTRKGLQMKATEKHQMVYDENSGKVSLTIKSIGPGDEGEYTCTALNPYGEAICTVYISPEATKSVKKSKSGAKLHKSSSNKQIQMQQQQQLMAQQQSSAMMQQQSSSFSSSMQQTSMSSSSSFHQESSSMMKSSQMSSSSMQIKQQNQQMLTAQNDPEVIYLKHVERTAQQQQRQEEEVSRYGPPSFLTPLNDLTIMEGEKAHLDAKVAPVGDPSIKVEWYCNGQAFGASSRVNTACQFGYVSLDMLNTTVSDSGEYTCVVQNEAGQTQSACRVVVQARKDLETDFYSQGIRQVEMRQESQMQQKIEISEAKPQKPEFVKPLMDVGNMKEGSNVHLEAQVNPVSDHTMTIDWFKDGKSITASSRIATLYSFGYVSLNITGLRVEDAGTYVCVARNASGEAMTQAQIGVVAEAKMTSATGIAEQQVYIEKAQQLEQYQQSKTMLTRMDSVQEPSQPPQFTTPMQDQINVREGGFAHFEARLEPMGDHTMVVDWFKDGKPVDASSRITSFFNFGYVALTIKQVAAHDAGLYSCVARNSKGQTKTEAQLTTISKADADFQSKSWSSIQQMEMSKSVKMSSQQEMIQTQQESPRFVSQLKGTTTILEGQHAHFECRLEPQNDPSLKVEWMHNGRPLSASSRIQTHHDFGYVALDIMDVKKEDCGTYILCASNALGRQEASIDLRVEAHAQSVDTTTMHAKTLEATQKFEMKSTKVSVQQEQQSLKSKPVFVTNLKDLGAPVVEGQNIHLEARLEPINDPSIKVEWLCNGRPLTIGSRFKTYNDFGFIALDIVGVNIQDGGNYVCRATNQLGQAETSAAVQVVAKSNVITETEHEAAMQQISYLESHQEQKMQMSSSMHQEMTSIQQGPAKPPQFTKSLKNVEVVEGQTVHLEARLSPTGDSTMKVEWTVNGKPLKTGHKIKPQYDFDYVALDLLNVYPEDAGTYTCTARNALGEATTSAQVRVSGGAQIVTESKSQMSQFTALEQKHTVARTEISDEQTSQAPVFTSSMKSIEVKEGQRAHFECRIIPVSDPTLKVEWLHNGKPLKQGSRFKEGMDFGFVYLDIMHVYPEDAGTYTLKATNVLGQAVNSADLNVKSKEIIVKETMHAAAVEQIAHLEQASSISQVSHEEGFTTQAPVFTSTMRDMNLMEGTPAHFEAKLIPIGDAKLKVEWLKNGKPIQASNRMSSLHDFGFVALDLKYTRPDDAGNYTCRAVNDLGEANITANLKVMSAKDPQGESLHGEALHKIAHLETKRQGGFSMEEDHVQAPPNFVVNLQGKTSLIEGQNLHVECRIEPYPDPTLNVEWYFNGKPLPFGNRWRTSYDFGFAALDIIGAYAEDSGRYTLKATNALGTAESHIEVKISPRSGLLLDSDHVDALEKIKYLESKHQRTAEEELAVAEAPQFGHGLKDLRLEEGQPAHFETTLTPVNDSTMRVEWLFNGKSVPQGHRFRTTYDFGFVALDILYAYPEDSGTYTCVATNNLGQTQTQSNLLVQAKAGLLLDTMDRERLTHLGRLEARDTKYKVQSETDAPITKPVFLSALKNVSNVAEQSNVHLECRLEPVNDPNLKVEWYVNGKAIKMGHRFRTTHDFGYVALDILYAYPEDNGTYMCKASNKLGEAVNTCSVEVVGKQSLDLDSHHPEGWEKVKHLEARSTAHGRLEVEDMPVGPPQFVTELMGQSQLSEGQIAHFEAQIEPIHDSDLTVEFLHNNRPLKQASRIHTLCDFGYVALDIGQLIESDGGTYTCKIKNKYGEATSSVTLSIVPHGSLDTSSVRPEGLEKIKALESRQARSADEEVKTFQKPVFTQPLKNLLKEENSSAHFSCTLIPVGDPTMVVEWFCNGQKVSTGTRINTMHDFGLVNLDISGVRSSDEGIYEVRATNSLGEAMTTASLKVASKGSLILDSQHPEGMRKITALESRKSTGKGQVDSDQSFDKPIFVDTLKGTEVVAEGQQAHMECRVEPVGDPNLKFTWLKNGEPLSMSSRIHATQDFGFVTLDIQSCVPEDSGMYTVRASNLSGDASSSLALHVGGKGGVLGDALHPDSYKKIQALEAQKRGVKQQISVEDIKQPPVFMEPLRDVGTVAEGSNVVVEARIEPKNDSKLRVEWEFNGKAISTGSRLRTSLDFGHVVLQIDGARASDSGLYTCKAINALGEAVSTTSVKVEEGGNVAPAAAKDIGPPKFVTGFSQVGELGEGQSCHLEARLTPVEDPNLKVEWLKDGKPLAAGHRFRTFHDFGIVILDILYCYAEDSGTYECRATNQHGSDSISISIGCSAKSGLILTPQVPGEMKQQTMERIQYLESMKMSRSTEESITHGVAPRFTVPIENMNNLKEGENAHFEARLIPTDDPTLSIEWYWNGKALKAGSRIRTFCDFGFVILEISPVYPEDSGEYTCKAKNALGEAVTTATLKCSGKRTVIMDTQLPRGMEGAMDKIADLEGLGRRRIMDDLPDDADAPPEFLSPLEDLTLPENSLAHFETRLTPINDPSMRVEWFHNGKQLSAGSRIKTINDFGFVILEVANVMTRDSGNYTCKAVNKHGETTVACTVQVKSKQNIVTDPQLPRSFKSGTDSILRLEENRMRRHGDMDMGDEIDARPPMFVSKIKDVNVIEGQPAHFDCRVEPIGDGSMQINWFHNGQPIQIGSRIHTISDFGFVVLDIDWTFKRDSGVYTCQATNRYGTTEITANLVCSSKKDINLDSQLPQGMSLDKLKDLEKGKTELRGIEDEAEITAPKFITKLQSRAVAEGEPVHFSCRVEPKHDPKLNITWYHNDKELPSGSRFRITQEFGYVALDILYTYPEDEGEYVCKAKNDLGEDICKCKLVCKELPAIQLENQVPKGMKKSEYLMQMEASMKKYAQEIMLTEDDVYDIEKRQPPRFVTQIQSVTDLVEMQATKFECQLAPVGDPNMKVEWFFNGKALPFKNRFTPIYDFGYVAMNFGWVYPEDSGEYVCRATNSFGMDETRGIIKTSGKPGIIYESQLPKGMASIDRIRKMEAGWQRAPDVAEQETERFKPCFVTKPEPQNVCEGEVARFCCRVTGYPKPRVMWLLNGHTVINGSKHKLVYDGMWHFDIPKCRDIDGGKVEVIARNSCGEAYSTTTLTVNPRQDDYRAVLRHNVKRDYVNSKEYRKPEWITQMEEIQKRLSEQKCSAKFTQEIKDQRVKEGMKCKFEALFAGNPKPEVTWEFDGKVIENSKNMQVKIKEGKTSLTIFEAANEHNGYYTCRVKNPIGNDKTRGLCTVSKPGAEKEKPKEKVAKMVKAEAKKTEPKKPSEQKPAKQPEPKPEAPKPEKTWGKSGSKKAEPPKEPEQQAKVELKKAQPKPKAPETEKKEMPSLKPTPKTTKEPEAEQKESVQLKPVKKEEPEQPVEKKPAPKSMPPAPKPDETDSAIQQATEATEKTQAPEVAKSEPVKTEAASVAQETNMKESVEALSAITERLRKGSTISEVHTAFEAHEFPVLERKTSQMALLAAVERSNKEAVNVQEIITQEEETEKPKSELPKQELRKKSLAKVGLTAFMATAIKEPERADEIISSLHLEDFAEAKAEKQYAKMILQSTELDIAQAVEISTEIKESVDTAVKEAVPSQVPEMALASSKQPETQESAVLGETASESTQVLNIQEGDVFFALATFVSETGEAMNLVEGEKVHVLEWNNTDWWYVRKHLTEESGWVPAQYLKDEQTYTMYVQKKLVEKIEKLPVFDKPKDGQEPFAPRILESVKSMSAADGSTVEFVCKVEGCPRPQITWFRQTAIIKPSQDFQIFYYEDNKATLVIKEVFPEDAGTFTCVAKNCVGFASSSAELIVEHPLSEHGSALDKHDRRSLSRESSLADIVEGIPPTFAQRPQTKTCEEGNSTELECRFVAIPEAEVQWFHNKQPLAENNRIKVENQADMHMYCSIVRISNVTKEDEGTYEVCAKNREGEATNTLILNVTGKPKEPVNEPPMIVKQLTPTVCKLGDSVKLETVITGTPTPKVEWTHNGTAIQTASGIKMIEKDNIYSLVIDTVDQNADGDYCVKAVNASGSVQTSANLTVQGEAIEFVKPLEDIEIKEQSNLEMDVETSAEDTNVMWYRDGEQISKTNENYEFKKVGRKHSLVIKKASVHLEGEYSAVVGEQETTCELTVVELPPSFTKKISNKVVTAGEQLVVFETELSKGDAVTKWYKGSTEIKDTDRFKIVIDGKVQRLEIHNVELSDAGEYLCTIGNEKSTAQLTVEEPKVNFVEKLESTTSGEVGKDIRLKVKLSNAGAHVTWFKDGAEVTQSEKVESKVEEDAHVLTIKGASIEDVGEYTCQAENVTSKTELEVQSQEEKIEIDQSSYSKDQVGTKGQDITFSVNFNQIGSKPKAQWFFNGQEVSKTERIITTVTRKMASMTIKQCEKVDCGSYSVKISNNVSEISVDFSLNIKDKPSPPLGPPEVEWKDDVMVLRWKASESDGGSAITEYVVERREVGKKTWKQVGTSTSKNTYLEIRGLKKNSSFNFRISAKNSVGNSAPLLLEETVTIKAEKAAPKGLPGSPSVQVTAVTSKSVTLNWSPPINTGGVELTGYIIEKRLSTTHKWEKAATVDPSVTQFTIENLKEKCEYYFRISAENEVGAGEATTTEKVALRTSARPPTQPTAPLEIVALGPHSIMVEWGAPESDGGAPLEGYKVAVRDANRHMWMEVGRVAADVQKLKVQELAEGNLYHLRIYAKNEVGFSDPLENEEPFKVVRPADYNEEEAEEDKKHDDTPSLSFSTTETLSSWMREQNVDADIQSYTKSTILRRDEYFFRIWHYAAKLFED